MPLNNSITGTNIMNNNYGMMDGMGSMMWPMGLVFLLVVVVLILAAAALIKYLFGGKK